MTHLTEKSDGARPANPLAEGDRPDPQRVVQITDPHLFADPSGRLLGLNTRTTFEMVLAQVLDRAAANRTAALVLTGDLVHDGSPEGYAYLRQVLDSTGLPCYCIPGNHDQPELLDRWLGDAAVGPLASRGLGPWNLIFLDSTIPGEDGGGLGRDQIEGVDRLLREDPAPTLVLLHQHPVPVGSVWMDTMDVRNGHELLAVCDRHPNVRALVFGHIHQEFAVQRGDYQILGTPSACVQFLPGSRDFAMDTRTPGYRELLLHPEGRLETVVRRLEAYPEPFRPDHSGY
jgi:Icc protein